MRIPICARDGDGDNVVTRSVRMPWGNIDWVLLGSLLTGSLPRIVIGSARALRMPEFVLRPALALVLTIVGVRLAM